MVGSGPHLTSILILGLTAQPEAAPPLIRVLSDRSSPCRPEAARALAGVPDSRAFPALKAALEDSDPRLRAEAAMTLAVHLKAGILDKEADRDALGRIAKLFRTDPKLSVRLKAYDALAGLVFDRGALLVLSQAGEESHVFGSVLTCRAVRQFALAIMEAGGEPDKRQAAERLLRILRQEDAWPLRSSILRAYFESRFHCASPRVQAAGSLGFLGSRMALPDLIRLARTSSDSALRTASIESIGEIAGEGVLETLAAALGDRNVTVRRTAMEALGKSGDPRAAGLVREILENGTDYERAGAAAALGSLGGHADALIRALGDDVVQVRATAESTLARDADEKTAEALVAALGDPNEHLRMAAARVLAQFSGKASRSGLIEELRRGKQPSASLAAFALGLRQEPESRMALEQALNNSQPSEMLAIVHALQDLNDPASLPQLGAFAENAPTPELEAAARLASRVLGGAEAPER
ncbi:MAG: HEAT repeat domain-containing protein [Deltaproteobacteria bacterium]|nr:HEAT repeat domain-containing protein [Deltaproteobacteria bacterium]